MSNRIELGRDSFNLCDVGGTPHLYFNDLGGAAFENCSVQQAEDYVGYYVSASIGAFVNTISAKAYRENSYVKSMLGLNCSLQQRLTSRVIDSLKKSGVF